MDFGNKLVSLRTNKQLTQKDLASLLNVSYTTISKWENNERLPDAQIMLKLTSIFDITIEELYQSINNDELNTLYDYKESFKFKKLQIISFFILSLSIAFKVIINIMYTNPFFDHNIEPLRIFQLIHAFLILIAITLSSISLVRLKDFMDTKYLVSAYKNTIMKNSVIFIILLVISITLLFI